MNATRETIEPAMRAAAEDVCGDYVEIVPADTRNLMGFYVSLRKLLIEVRLPSLSCSLYVRKNFTDIQCHSVASTTSHSQIS